MPVVSFDDGIASYSNPPTITAYQARVALSDAGLLDQVENLIGSPETPIKIKLAWNTGINLRRDNPMISLLTSQLGLSPSDVDDLFAHAKTIVQGAL